MEKGKLVRFSISLEESLLGFIDDRMIPLGYASRSEFLRDLIRKKMIDEKWEIGKEAIGVLTLIYDHHQRELASKMTALQHNTLANIICNLHVHISHHDCLEVIIIKGNKDEIEKVTTQIGGLRGVKYYNLSKVAPFCEEIHEENGHHHTHTH